MSRLLNKIYSMKTSIGGLRKKGRLLLAKLLKAAPETISVNITAKALGVSSKEASILLASWAKRGWLSRLQRGLYIRIPLQSSTTEIIPEEPKLVAHALISPCYIGGWSACEHWNLTEQIFNTIVIYPIKTFSEYLSFCSIVMLIFSFCVC